MSTPLKFIGESTKFAKKTIRGFGGLRGGCCGGGTVGGPGVPPGGCCGGGVEEDDERLNEIGRI